MFVRQWMSSPADLLLSDTPLMGALNFMEAASLQHLVVIGRGRIDGVVSRNDIYRLLASGENPKWRARKRLCEIVQGPAVTVSPYDNLRHAAEILLKTRTSAIPVVVEDHLIGIITETDVVRAFAATPDGERPLTDPFDDITLLDEMLKPRKAS